jgi:hypothetical protein
MSNPSPAPLPAGRIIRPAILVAASPAVLPGEIERLNGILEKAGLCASIGPAEEILAVLPVAAGADPATVQDALRQANNVTPHESVPAVSLLVRYERLDIQRPGEIIPHGPGWVAW